MNTYKLELERRLNKPDYTKLPQALGLGQTYSDITSDNDFKKMLHIADRYGQKYIMFFKLKEDVNINTILSNLINKSYSPNIPMGNMNLKVAYVKKTGNNFEIIANSYSEVMKWKDITDTRREKVSVITRRVAYIEYNHSTKILTFAQDPIGEGAGITQDMSIYLNEIFSEYNLFFDDLFETIELLKPVCTLIDDGVLSSSKLQGTDEATGRQHETVGKNKRDNLKDDNIFKALKDESYSLNRIRLGHKNFKGTFEVFSGNILRIWFNINGDNTSELKTSITSIL